MCQKTFSQIFHDYDEQGQSIAAQGVHRHHLIVSLVDEQSACGDSCTLFCRTTLQAAKHANWIGEGSGPHERPIDCNWIADTFDEGKYLLDIGQLWKPRPVLFCGGAHNPEDCFYLLQLIWTFGLPTTIEQYILCDELGHDAAQAPDIEGSGITFLSCICSISYWGSSLSFNMWEIVLMRKNWLARKKASIKRLNLVDYKKTFACYIEAYTVLEKSRLMCRDGRAWLPIYSCSFTHQTESATQMLMLLYWLNTIRELPNKMTCKEGRSRSSPT